MDYLKKILDDYKNQNFEKGVFCDSLVLRDITGKSEHFHVIRDIRVVIKQICENLGVEAIGLINFDPFDLDKNLLEQIKSSPIDPNFGGVKNEEKEFRFRAVIYKDNKGEERAKIELSEKAYITMMGYYSDYITLLLYRFYARVTHARQVTVQDLIKLNRYELEDLYEVMQITEAIESSVDKKEIESLRSKMNEKIEDYSKNYENYFEMDIMLVIASNKNLMHRRGSDVYATVGDIAAITQKRTDHIIRDITVIMDNIRKVDPKINFRSMYRETYYTTSKNREARTFTMSEEGFVLLIWHYDVTMIWMLANFYVEMKKIVVPKITELIAASSDMVYDAIQYYNECDKFLIQLTGVNHNKGANYVENKEKEIIEQLNEFRKSKEQKLLRKWDPDKVYDDVQMRSYLVTPRYMDL